MPPIKVVNVAIIPFGKSIEQKIVTYLNWQEKSLFATLLDRLKGLLRKLADAIKRILGINNAYVFVVKESIPPVIQPAVPIQIIFIQDQGTKVRKNTAIPQISKTETARPVGAAFAASSSPFNSESAFSKPVWLTYLDEGLRSSDPDKRARIQEMILEVIRADSDLVITKEHADQYPLLIEFINKNMPLRETRMSTVADSGENEHNPATAKPSVERVDSNETAVGVGPTVVSNLNNQKHNQLHQLRPWGVAGANDMPLRETRMSTVADSGENEHDPATAKYLFAAGKLNSTIRGWFGREKIEQSFPVAPTLIEDYKPFLEATRPTASPQAEIRGRARSQQNQRFWGMAGFEGRDKEKKKPAAAPLLQEQGNVVTLSKWVNESRKLITTDMPLREFQSTASLQLGRGKKHNSPATVKYHPEIYPVQEMPMAASPVAIEKELSPWEALKIPIRQFSEYLKTFYRGGIENTEISYLNGFLLNLPGRIWHWIVKVFEPLSNAFKIVFHLNEHQAILTEVDHSENLSTRKTADPLARAAVIVASASPIRGGPGDEVWMRFYVNKLDPLTPFHEKYFEEFVGIYLSGQDEAWNDFFKREEKNLNSSPWRGVILEAQNRQEQSQVEVTEKIPNIPILELPLPSFFDVVPIIFRWILPFRINVLEVLWSGVHIVPEGFLEPTKAWAGN